MTELATYNFRLPRWVKSTLRLIVLLFVACFVVVVTKWNEIVFSGLFGAAEGVLRIAPERWNYAYVIPVLLVGWPMLKRDIAFAAVAVAVQISSSIYIDYSSGLDLNGRPLGSVVATGVLLELFAVAVATELWALTLENVWARRAAGLLLGISGTGALVSAFSATPATAVWVVAIIVAMSLTIRNRGELVRDGSRYVITGVVAMTVALFAWATAGGGL